MSYCTVDDLLTRISSKELQQATDLDATGAIDNTRAEAVIAEASSIIDAFARQGGFTVPWTDLVLARSLAAQLSICMLLRGRNLLNEAREKACDKCEEFLKMVAESQISIEEGDSEAGVIMNDLETQLTTDRFWSW